jgi:hypothetical protein
MGKFYIFSIKKIFLLLFFISFAQVSAQMRSKDFSRIMKSKSIYEIDGFLRVAHPNDSKRLVLKPRLVELITEYLKYAHPADSRIPELQEKLALLKTKSSTAITFEEMQEAIKQKQIALYKEELRNGPRRYASGGAAASQTSQTEAGVVQNMSSEDQADYKAILAETPTVHKEKTVKILNSLFDNDPASKESIVMVENKSACDILVKIEGVGGVVYKLAVPASTQQSTVVEKGNYLFSSSICGAEYVSQKTVQKAIMVSLNNK